MDQWNQSILEEEERNDIQHLIDSHGMILFFKKDKDYFGAGEDSRVVFARLKNPDEDTPSGWADEANFTAENLSKIMRGEPGQQVFDKSDLSKIKIMDKDKIVEELKKIPKEKGEHFNSIKVIKLSRLFSPNHSRDDAPNFTRADEDE